MPNDNGRPDSTGKQLDQREQRFVELYLKYGIAAKSAREAGYSNTMADKKCPLWVGRSRESCPPNKLHVWDEWNKLNTEIRKKNLVDADSLHELLSEQVYGDPAELYDEHGKIIQHPREWPMWARRGGVTKIKRDKDTGVIVELTLANRDKCRELVGRHVNVAAFEKELGTGEIHIHLDEKDSKA